MADLLIVGLPGQPPGVLLVILGGKEKGSNQGLSVGLAVASVLVSWLLVQTNFTTRYARLYYTGVDGGIASGATRSRSTPTSPTSPSPSA